MQARVRITLDDYLIQLRTIIGNDKTELQDKPKRWIAMVAAIRRKQRAYGTRQALSEWIEQRGMRLLEQALPG